MENILKKPILSVLLLLAICGYFFFLQSGSMSLTDPDETFYAQSAKEMLQRGEWLTPYLYDKPQFEKPILFYWLIEASYKVFGVNEFAARFPSAVMALAGVIAIYFLGNLLFNRRVGILAAFILASCVEYIMLSRACVTDMTLNTLMLLGALFFFLGHFRGRLYFYLLSGAAFAFATLTKGPVAIILPAAAIFLYFLFAKDLKSLMRVYLIPFVIVFILVAAPWFIAAYKIHGKEFIDAFFGFQNVNRFLEAEHKIGSQFYYNVPVILGGFFPWSAFLPFAFWHLFKRILTTKSSIFVLSWFFTIFIFFSISSTKLPTYVFPAFTSLALMVAVMWDDFLKKDAGSTTARGMRFSYYFLAAAVFIGSLAAVIFVKIDYPVILKGIVISCLCLIAVFVASIVAFVRKKFITVFFLIIVSVILFFLPFSIFVLPELEHYETSKPIAMKLLTMAKPDEAIGSESNYLAGLAFYTGKIPTDLDKHHELVKFIGSKDRVWGVLKEKNHRELYELQHDPPYAEPSYMVYKIGKRAIVTNKIPDDGVYLVKREKK